MHNIEIIMEKRIEKSFEVSDEVYEYIKDTGNIPDELFEVMEELLMDKESDVYYDYDYAVYDEDNEEQIVEWS